MKKNIIILFGVLATLSLMAFGYVNWSTTATNYSKALCKKTAALDNDVVKASFQPVDLDLVYNVDSRYMATITKEDLDNAKSAMDIIPKTADWSTYPVQNLEVTIIDQITEPSEMGDNLLLNQAQAQLLRSTDYSDSFRLIANCKGKHKDIDREFYDLAYFITIIPEKEAEYPNGQDALIEYLKKSSKEVTGIIKQDKLQPGRVFFTVTKEGRIANVKLDSTSGYSEVDDALVESIRNMPEKWNPATNSKGEKVDQELVFFFGVQGC